MFFSNCIFTFVNLCFLIAVVPILLILANNIHKNPGPLPLKKCRQLNICHSNIRSLSRAKLLAIQTSLSSAFDIITLSETHLSANVTSDVFDLKGFHGIIRKDRNGYGGGVAIYVKENLIYKRQHQYERNDIEAVWIQINSSQGKFLICCAYRPPTDTEFWDRFSSVLDDVKSDFTSNVLILGDLNADFNTANGKKMKELCISQNCQYLINQPTRITATTSTVLDQIITNSPAFIESVSVGQPLATSDHCTISVKIRFDIPKEKPYERHIWDYKKADFLGYKQAIANYDFGPCFETDDIDLTCKRWTDVILTEARNFIPNKVVLIRPNDSPWYNNELRKMKRKVNRLFRKFKEKKSTQSWESYREHRNSYQQKLSEAETNYRKSLHASLESAKNVKKWWAIIKDILGKGNDTSYPTLVDGNTYFENSEDKANHFNNFFLSHNDIDTTNAVLPNEQNDNIGGLGAIEATEQEVHDLIKAIDCNKATGPDGICPKLLKEADIGIVPSLTKLINKSLKQSKTPLLWKKAHMLPLFKKGCKADVNNYRPVSILSSPSKILEKIVFKHVYNYFRDNELLTKHQSGFQTGDSTVHQLSYLYHKFSEALDQKKEIRLVFCDISKAFDKVWHYGILYKLKKLGIHGSLLKWFSDYLDNRCQRVIVRGQNSAWGFLKAGVPQGSVLGPLLFLVYINDIIDGLSCNIKLFADDTTLYITYNDEHLAHQVINENLEKVSDWARKWLVSFSPSKTKAMTISFKKRNPEPLQFDHKNLDDVSEHKHLGLTLSSNLTWSSHINNIISEATRMSDVLKRLKYDLDRSTLEKIYFSFIRPKLEYAAHIWDNCSKKDSDKLEQFQIEIAKTVTGARKGTSHDLLYSELKWETLSQRRTNSKLLNIHRIVNNNAPSYMCNLIPQNNEDNRYNLRNKSEVKMPKTRTETFRRSFIPSSINLWNNLEHEYRLLDFETFKTKLKVADAPNKLYYLSH